MLFIKAITLTGLAVSQVAAHGLITRVKGHNGIDMPGLTSRFLHDHCIMLREANLCF